MRTQWTNKQLQEMIRRYRAGQSCEEIGALFNVSRHAILAFLKRNSNVINKRWKPSKDEYFDIKNKREQGWTWTALGDERGIVRQSVVLRYRSCLQLYGSQK